MHVCLLFSVRIQIKVGGQCQKCDFLLRNWGGAICHHVSCEGSGRINQYLINQHKAQKNSALCYLPPKTGEDWTNNSYQRQGEKKRLKKWEESKKDEELETHDSQHIKSSSEGISSHEIMTLHFTESFLSATLTSVPRQRNQHALFHQQLRLFFSICWFYFCKC